MIRINKILKEINVSVSTAADYLKSVGRPMKEITPNTKITDEQCELLKNEFCKPKEMYIFDGELFQ